MKTHSESRISIALCTYNGARYLEEQLDSFLWQTRLPDEIVIYDDASTDGTLRMLEAFAHSAPFAVTLERNAQNLGYRRNFAQAVERCSGDLVFLSDQDDRWHAEKLERFERQFRDQPDAAGVFCDGDLMDEQSAPLPGSLWASFGFRPADQRRLAAGKAVDVLLQRNVVTGMAFAFRAQHRRHLQNLPASWPHDAWLALFLAMEAPLVACAERLVSYRVHPQQQIGTPMTRSEKQAHLRKHGPAGYLFLSLKRNQAEYRKDAAQYADLLPALAVGAKKLHCWLPQARQKADHLLMAGERLGLSRLRRAPKVLAHWNDYRRYSPTGLRAMLRDLLLGASQRGNG